MSRSQEEQPNYSEKYSDDTYEYRHVHLPKNWVKLLPDDRHLLSEAEWRALGVCQSRGWEHYMHHEPEPGILLFRRLLSYQVNPQEEAQLQIDIKRYQIDFDKKRAALKAAGQLK